MPHVLCLIILGINHYCAYSMEPVFIIPSTIRHNTCCMDYVNAVPGLLSRVRNSPPPWPNLRPFRPHLPTLSNFLVQQKPPQRPREAPIHWRSHFNHSRLRHLHCGVDFFVRSFTFFLLYFMTPHLRIALKLLHL